MIGISPTLSQRVERFSLMAAILAIRFPHKAAEFWATIIHVEWNYQGTQHPVDSV
jgi:hypothetical protein